MYLYVARRGFAKDSFCRSFPPNHQAGGIAGKPLRETAVENSLKGKSFSADLAGQAVSVALANAAPLKYNATKIDMAKGLLASGLTKLGSA